MSFLFWRFSFRDEDHQNSSRKLSQSSPLTPEQGVDEFGRTPHPQGGSISRDGTRSFLNGWFALDSIGRNRSRRSNTHVLSHPTGHVPLKDFEKDEWEVGEYDEAQLVKGEIK